MSETDSKNLRFYASLFRERQWETENIHWNVFATTLDEIAAKLSRLQQLVKAHIDNYDEAGHCEECQEEEALCVGHMDATGEIHSAMREALK